LWDEKRPGKKSYTTVKIHSAVVRRGARLPPGKGEKGDDVGKKKERAPARSKEEKRRRINKLAFH